MAKNILLEPSVLTKCPISLLSKMVAISHSVAAWVAKCGYHNWDTKHLILLNLNLNSHMGLVGIILEVV